MERNEDLTNSNMPHVEKAQYSSYRKAQLISMLENQHSTLAAMKRVFYTETNELRERLMALNTENSFLKDALKQKEAEVCEPSQSEAALREKLRPLLEKLTLKHNAELDALRLEYRSLKERLLTTETALSDMRVKAGSLLTKKKAAEEALIRLQAENLKLSKALNDEEALVKHAKTLDFAEAGGELSQKALYVKLDEYKAALRASIKLAERQEETIKTLNEELKESEAAFIALRKEQSERLKGIRHQVEQLNALLEPPIEQQAQSSIKQFPLPKKT